MSYKIVVTKAMSQDEQLQAEVTADTKGALEMNLAAVLAILDARLVVQGERVIAAMTNVKRLPVAAQQAVNACMGILFGRPGAQQEFAVAEEALAREAKAAAAGAPDEGGEA